MQTTTPDPGRWRKICNILDEVTALDAPERFEYLQRLRAENDSLHAHVAEFLQFEQEDTGDLFSPEFDIHEDPGIGVRYGPYRTTELLGKGGMGAVYLAEREGDFEQTVAIKEMRAGLEIAGADLVRRFETERQILAVLDHPNIARLIDGGTTPAGRPYFVMDRVDGVPLESYCEEQDLDPRARLRLFLKICSAVSYAHRRLVIHRDLKPSNILVDRSGEPKLLDFGIAKLLGDELDDALKRSLGGAVQTRGGVGTIGFAAPEQMTCGEPATTAVDVWALGVMLYRLLAGRHPFPDVDLEHRAPPKPPSELAHEDRRHRLKGDLDAIVLQALRIDPRDRYASVDALADDVRRFLDDEPVLARRDTPLYRAGKFARRKPWATAFAVLLLLFALAASGLGLQAMRERDRAEELTQLYVEMYESIGPELQGKDALLIDFIYRQMQGLRARGSPQVRARVLAPLRDAFDQLQDQKIALELAKDVLCAEIAGGESSKLARAASDYAAYSFQTGKYEDAWRFFHVALALKERLGEDPIKHLIARGGLAAIYQENGEIDQAEEIYLEIQRIRQEYRSTKEERTWRNLAMISYLRGDLQEAERRMLRSLSFHDESSLNGAKRRGELGRILLAQGRLEEAQELLEEAMRVLNDDVLDSSLSLARIRNDLAALLLRRGGEDLDRVDDLLEQARWVLAVQRPGNWENAVNGSLRGAAAAVRGLDEEAERLLRAGWTTLHLRRGDALLITREARERYEQFLAARGRSLPAPAPVRPVAKVDPWDEDPLAAIRDQCSRNV